MGGGVTSGGRGWGGGREGGGGVGGVAVGGRCAVGGGLICRDAVPGGCGGWPRSRGGSAGGVGGGAGGRAGPGRGRGGGGSRHLPGARTRLGWEGGRRGGGWGGYGGGGLLPDTNPRGRSTGCAVRELRVGLEGCEWWGRGCAGSGGRLLGDWVGSLGGGWYGLVRRDGRKAQRTSRSIRCATWRWTPGHRLLEEANSAIRFQRLSDVAIAEFA